MDYEFTITEVSVEHKHFETGNAKQQQLKYSLSYYYLLQKFRLPLTCIGNTKYAEGQHLAWQHASVT